MGEELTEPKERYIDEACRIASGESEEAGEQERAERIQFWQRLTDEDRINATWEIARRVHLASGGSPQDLKLDKSAVRLLRRR